MAALLSSSDCASHTEKLKHPWWSKQSSNLLGGAQNRISIEAFKYKLLMNDCGFECLFEQSQFLSADGSWVNIYPGVKLTVYLTDICWDVLL